MFKKILHIAQNWIEFSNNQRWARKSPNQHHVKMNKTTNIIINLWNVQWIDSTILQKNKSDLKLFARWFKLLKYTYTFSAPVNRWDLFSWLNLPTAKTKISLKQLVQRKQNAFVHVHWPCIQCKLIIWPRENKQNSCTFRWKYWSRWLCWSFNRMAFGKHWT